MDPFVLLAAGSHATAVGIAGWGLLIGGIVGIALWLLALTRTEPVR